MGKPYLKKILTKKIWKKKFLEKNFGDKFIEIKKFLGKYYKNFLVQNFILSLKFSGFTKHGLKKKEKNQKKNLPIIQLSKIT